MEDVRDGLTDLVRVLRDYKVQSVAIPPLGCGLGGLDWDDVRAMIESTFEDSPGLRVDLYEPKGAPRAGDMVIRTRTPKMTLGRAALLAALGCLA